MRSLTTAPRYWCIAEIASVDNDGRMKQRIASVVGVLLLVTLSACGSEEAVPAPERTAPDESSEVTETPEATMSPVTTLPPVTTAGGPETTAMIEGQSPSTSAAPSTTFNVDDVLVGDLTLSVVYSPPVTVRVTEECGSELTRAMGRPLWGVCLESWAAAMDDPCGECEGVAILQRVGGQWTEYSICYQMWFAPSSVACMPDFPADTPFEIQCAVYFDNHSLMNLARTGCPPYPGELEAAQVDGCSWWSDPSEWWTEEDRTVLDRCTKGRLVTKLQEVLIGLGYPLEADGYFGPMTTRALIDVQRANGLVISGVTDEPTLELLFGTSTLL